MSNTALLGSYGAQDSSSLMFRNRIINGAAEIDQRNGGASISITSGNAKFSCDRFFCDQLSTGGAWTAQQVSDAPAGLVNSLKATITTARTMAATEYAYIRQIIEGYNIADFAFGTSSAKSITFSFWVKSSLTGTFGGYLGSNANARMLAFTYSISAANTWEYKTVTIAGDTSGTWLTNNGVGLQVAWSLGCGSTYRQAPNTWSASLTLGATGQVDVIATLNATWQVTGVQLEAGPTATPFERRPIGVETQLAMRYYFKISPDASNYLFFGWAKGYSANNLNVVINNPVPLRAKATTLDLTALSTYAWETGSTLGNTPTTITIDGQVSNFNSTSLGVAKTGAFTAGAMYWFIANNTTASIGIGAEL